MNNYTRFLKLIFPHFGVFSLAVFCMLMSTLFGASPLALIIPLVDIVISNKDIVPPDQVSSWGFVQAVVSKLNSMPKTDLLKYMSISVVFMFLFKGIFEFFQTYLMHDVGLRVVRDTKNSIYEKLQQLSMDFYHKNPTGQLMSRITYDASVIQEAVSSGLADTVYQPIQILAYLAVVVASILWGVPWKLILISFFLFPLILYPVIRIGKRLRKISKASQEKFGGINNMLLETITGIKLVKSFCMEDYEKKRFNEQNHIFYKLNLKSVKKMKLVSPMTECMGVVCVAIILWMAGNDIVTGKLSSGTFIMFIAAVFSTMKPAKRLSNVYGINQKALAAAERIFELLDAPVTITEKEDPVKISSFEDVILFDKVNFSYDSGKETVLHDIELEIKKGEIVALVGPSGAGKSTLVNLIPRFYDPDTGCVKIDGDRLVDLKIRSLRNLIGMVTQENLMFNDTVKMNISYGHGDVDEERLMNVAKAANAYRFIKNFPEGFDTVIGERGLQISGGQRQRLAIARAIYKNPPILIFDEATSQLDTESEKLVQEAINNLMKGRTSIVIAHRLSTVKHADKIIVMDAGRIIATGTHEELLEKNPLYKKLYEMQYVGQGE